MNRSNPARTLVMTANRTTKRLFHKALSNVLFQKLMLATAPGLGFQIFNPKDQDEFAWRWTDHPGCASGLNRRSAPVAPRIRKQFRTMEIMAPATIRLWLSAVSKPSATPSSPRIKENSPIWARLAATMRAVPSGYRHTRTIRNAAAG